MVIDDQKCKILIIFLFFFFASAGFGYSKCNSVEQYYSLADQYLKKGNIKVVDQIYTQGIKKNPKSYKLYYFRGKLRSDYMGDCDRAVPDYSNVIRLNPRYNPKVFWRRGVCLYKRGLYKHALIDYSNCLKLKPKYGRVHFYKGMAYTKLRMFKKAKKQFFLATKYDKSYKKKVQEILLKIQRGILDFD